MISGGNATVFVNDLENAVEFYGGTLGLNVTMHAPGHFAMIDAGGGFLIGLHPAGKGPTPGAKGGMQVGLTVTRPIQEVVDALKARGVSFSTPVIDDGPVKLAFFEDPDGNDLYLCETT